MLVAGSFHLQPEIEIVLHGFRELLNVIRLLLGIVGEESVSDHRDLVCWNGIYEVHRQGRRVERRWLIGSLRDGKSGIGDDGRGYAGEDEGDGGRWEGRTIVGFQCMVSLSRMNQK
jgi:hypothetical protein